MQIIIDTIIINIIKNVYSKKYNYGYCNIPSLNDNFFK